MKIGFIGAGEMGGTLIRQYSRTGHSVKMANSSGPEKLKSLALETGASAVPQHLFKNTSAKTPLLILVTITLSETV
jgi:predicted dinucleotide-binding enzyme